MADLQPRNEKAEPLFVPKRTARKAPSASFTNLVICLFAAGLAAFSFQYVFHWNPSVPLPHPNLGSEKAFRWTDIAPSPSLEFHPCFDKFQCARLEVPLDWNETTKGEGPKAAIAILKKPAAVAVTDGRYGGPILFNPGGPGGSGIALLLNRADQFDTVLNPQEPGTAGGTPLSDDDIFFDFMSWDPRGINNTTPVFTCIPDRLIRQTWETEIAALGVSFDDPETFNKVWALQHSYAANCGSTTSSGNAVDGNSDEHLGKYISTANVVRDMVEIIERHGEWREKEAKALLMRARSPSFAMKEAVEKAAWRKGEEMLQYWGFSYGSILGQTFASMQPHRVGRVVLDGIADLKDYMENSWSKNLNDVDELTRNFTSMCYYAGPDRCAFYDSRGIDEMSKSFHSILDNLKVNPLIVTPDETNVPTIITHSAVVQALHRLYYTAWKGFTEVANFMDGLAHGNGTYFINLRKTFKCEQDPMYQPDTDATAGLGIRSSDGDPLINTTKADFQSYISHLNSQSPIFGNVWAAIRLQCTGYPVRAKWRFEGPPGAKTANPILFASQTYDPCTPLINAHTASKLFPGSEVVEAGGLGHCSLSMPSVCAAKTIRKYFRTGEVPKGGRRCERSAGPFGEGDVAANAEDARLGKTLRKLAEDWDVGGFY